MIIALDTATVCGWAAGPVGAHPPLLQWGARNFGGAGKSNGEIIAIFRGWFVQRCYELKPVLCVFESPYVPIGNKPGGGAPLNPLVLRRLLGMTGAIESVCWELKIDCRESVSSAFVKFLTGKGQYKKREEKKAAVVEACRYHGWDVGGDDNAADALALWAYAEAIISPRAAEARRRLAADRDRELNGAGPLFAPPETEDAPRAAIPRGVDDQPDRRKVEWPKKVTASI